MIFDTHAHYDDKRFDLDRHELLTQSLKQAGICRIMNVSSDAASLDTAYRLSIDYPDVYAALGLHPSEIKGFSDAVCSRIKEMVQKNSKVRAIGEIGLDYHYGKDEEREQKECFEKQIEMAKEMKLPIIVHSRDAAKDTMDVIRGYYTGKEGMINGVIHCFSYSPEEAFKYIELGFVIGIGGVVTYKNGRKLKDVVTHIPLDKLVLETDCPYLAPVPHRGERNSSLFLPFTVQAIAALKDVSEEEVERVTFSTANSLYNIP